MVRSPARPGPPGFWAMVRPDHLTVLPSSRKTRRVEEDQRNPRDAEDCQKAGHSVRQRAAQPWHRLHLGRVALETLPRRAHSGKKGLAAGRRPRAPEGLGKGSPSGAPIRKSPRRQGEPGKRPQPSRPLCAWIVIPSINDHEPDRGIRLGGGGSLRIDDEPRALVTGDSARDR